MNGPDSAPQRPDHHDGDNTMTIRAALIGPATLAADDLLTHPDATAIVGHIRAGAPTWLLDQLDAAGQQIARGLHAAAHTTTGLTVTAEPAEQHPAWVRLGALAALMTWLAGHGATCQHSPTPSAPQPLAAAAWRPHLIVCARCSHLLELPRNSTADRRTCDGCGRITTGTAHGDGIWPAVVQVGLLTYLIGCCRDCRYWSGTTPPDDNLDGMTTRPDKDTTP